MNLSKLLFTFATVAPIVLLPSLPHRLLADTYSLQRLDTDSGRIFYGMDDSRHVVFSLENTDACGFTANTCYETFSDGSFLGRSTVAPAFAYDYVAGACLFPQPLSLPCGITNNGRIAVIAAAPLGEETLSVSSGSNPAQLLYTTGFGPRFALNGVGDIVFDDGLLDEWYDAVDLSTAPIPEPASIFLLATGAITLALAPRRNRCA
jgi:hypothetical protein